MKLILQELFIRYVKNTLKANSETKLNSNLYRFEKFISKNLIKNLIKNMKKF